MCVCVCVGGRGELGRIFSLVEGSVEFFSSLM